MGGESNKNSCSSKTSSHDGEEQISNLHPSNKRARGRLCPHKCVRTLETDHRQRTDWQCCFMRNCWNVQYGRWGLWPFLTGLPLPTAQLRGHRSCLGKGGLGKSPFSLGGGGGAGLLWGGGKPAPGGELSKDAEENRGGPTGVLMGTCSPRAGEWWPSQEFNGAASGAAKLSTCPWHLALWQVQVRLEREPGETKTKP